MIKFRKGGLPTMATPAAAPVSTPAPAPAFVTTEVPLTAAATSSFKATQMPVREWWDTPSRYKRRQVDESECDLINVSKWAPFDRKSKTFVNTLQIKLCNQCFFFSFQGGGCDKLYQ